MDKTVQKIYGERVRIRVCGLCWKGDSLLLVNHWGLYKHDFWAPPGGGLEFGEVAEKSLVREFREETGLEIQVGEFQFACEFIQRPLHAIELFFEARSLRGKLTTGEDPEMGEKEQLIKEVKYLTGAEIKSLPEGHIHGVFKLVKNIEKIRGLRGYLKI